MSNKAWIGILKDYRRKRLLNKCLFIANLEFDRGAGGSTDLRMGREYRAICNITQTDRFMLIYV